MIWPFIYNYLIVPVVKLILPVIAGRNTKLGKSIRGKQGCWLTLDEQLKQRDPARKTIWFHAPSAGEYIQLQPLLEVCLNNGYDCAITYNSISAEKWIENSSIKADRQPFLFSYMPFDFKRNIRKWIKLLQPSALVFIKYDLWPNTIWETVKAGIPVYLVSATLHPKTKRYLSPIGRSFYANIYSQFNRIFVVDEADQKRFLKTNPRLNQIEVAGDIRYDATLHQRDRKTPPEMPGYIQNKLVFILGSSWPPDEDCVFPALKKALAAYKDLFVIIAPHEPAEKHLTNSEGYFDGERICRFSHWQNHDRTEYRILLIDSVGILSSLYRFGTIGYIGGGFTTGVHNVMEPCAMGLPVFFGPIHYNSGEAVQLTKQGLAFPVSNAGEFEQKFFERLADLDKTRETGRQARNYIEAQTGATKKCYQAISRELGPAIQRQETHHETE